ncbi:sulfotransferase family 2 domain-containing protein [Roseovarius sp.]|uniref:sulfotransferase family 2 domain-containing protein n=1 Tax=Roseovarius sp. TaxID=1486281 RepID=UPI00261AC4B5|nr:sulfotransferase family 2 domain-containing protein [Roseovarius sp.]MDM8167592.1 sulfotransferase family 2 domain-containing protein [Roseovarius sp.]
MAVISRDHRFLYFLNPRTASTATAALLREVAKGEAVPEKNILNDDGTILVPAKHTRLEQLIAHGLISEDVRRDYLKIVTVRNPFDSLVSLWAKMNHDYVKLLEDETSWVHRKPDYKEKLEASVGLDFPEWVRLHHGERFRKGKTTQANGSYMVGMDVLLRFERLQDDFADIARRLNLPGDHLLPRRNVTQGREETDYRSYYDKETRKIVASVFAPEIEALGYEF